MKIGVITFPGSNCDRDMIYVWEQLLEQEVVNLWHKSNNLQNCNLVILPGGFSYGDYLRSGAIARFSPIMQQVAGFASEGGFVLGVCNGFQILCEAGLLPGALLHNSSRKFICKNVFIKPEHANSLITASLNTTKAYKIPIAHGEGKFYTDQETLKNLNEKKQILFRYCDARGDVTPESNPNGSLQNIAGICNEKKNIFGMMPHPERAADVELGNTDGKEIFRSILDAVAV
ncbi:MAG: phosphoribosylformylglycinamidine synthase subunit PurQ [Flavobacteriales bacterium]|nr:phosphoribosylformylglycinamidine synthase subunit PurQ [Flavobacteriales bacterium]